MDFFFCAVDYHLCFCDSKNSDRKRERENFIVPQIQCIFQHSVSLILNPYHDDFPASKSTKCSTSYFFPAFLFIIIVKYFSLSLFVVGWTCFLVTYKHTTSIVLPFVFSRALTLHMYSYTT